MINLWSHTGCLIQLDRRKQMCQSTSLLSNSLQFDTVPVNNIFTLSKSDLCVLMSIRFSVSFWTRTFLSRVSGLHPADAGPSPAGTPKNSPDIASAMKDHWSGCTQGPCLGLCPLWAALRVQSHPLLEYELHMHVAPGRASVLNPCSRWAPPLLPTWTPIPSPRSTAALPASWLPWAMSLRHNWRALPIGLLALALPGLTVLIQLASITICKN